MEEVSVLVYDVDAVDVTVRCLDVGSVVCGDAGMMEWFLDSRGVSKVEFAGRADHHYCTGITVSLTDIHIPALTEVTIAK